MYPDFSTYLTEAIDRVIATDYCEESFAEAVRLQACALAGIAPDELLWHYGHD